MARIAKNRFLTRAALVMAALIFVLCTGQALLADEIVDDDPSIMMGATTSIPGGALSAGEGSNTWILSDQSSFGSVFHYFFQNNTGAAWTSIEISAFVGGNNSQTFSSDFQSSLFQSGTSGFTTNSVSTASGHGGDTVIFDFSGASVASGAYLDVRFNNWPSSPNSNPTSVFTFSANGAASPVPEPGSFALLGSGIAGLTGLVRRKLIAR